MIRFYLYYFLKNNAFSKSRTGFQLIVLAIIFNINSSYAQFPYAETFKNTTAPGMLYGGTAALTAPIIDAAGSGYLRLTTSLGNTLGYAYNDSYSFPSNFGYSISYEYFMWDKSGGGSDGVVFFLYNATTTSATFQPGGGSGSMGYAQGCLSVNGLSSGYLGVAMDWFGDYSSPIALCNASGPGVKSGSVVVRGAGDGFASNQYPYLGGVQTTSLAQAFSLAPVNVRTFDSTAAGYRRTYILLTPLTTGGYNINVKVKLGGTPTTLVGVLNTVITTTSPPKLKFGFSGSTNSFPQVNEVRNLTIDVPSTAALVAPTATNDVGLSVCNNTSASYTVTGNDISNNAGGGINKATVDINPTVAGIQTSLVVAGAGTYNSDIDGSISFTPLGSFTGSAVVKYVVNDTYGKTSNIATATFTVLQAPVLTVTSPPSNCASVNITAAAVTSGSSSGTLSYYNTLANANAATGAISNAAALTVSGTYYIRLLSSSNVCFSVQTVNVAFNPIQNNTLTSPASVCNSITRPTITGSNPTGASGAYTYFWESSTVSSISGFTTASGANTGINYVAPTISGTTWYRRTVFSSTCSDVSPAVRITVDNLPTTATITGGNQDLCLAVLTLLTANSPTSGSGVWSQLAGPNTSIITTPTLNITGVTGMVAGTYVYQWAITNGSCAASTATVTVTNSSILNLSITNPVAVCNPNTVDLTNPAISSGSSAGNYTYFTDPGATTSISGPANISVSGTYYVKLTNATNLCNIVKPVNVTVNSLPTLTVTAPAAVCSPNTVNLTAAALTLGSSPGALSYYTDASGLNSLTGAANISVSGTYYVKLTNLSSCNVMLPVSVTVNPLPVLTITAPASVCSPNKVNLTAPALTLGSTLGNLGYFTDAAATTSLTGAANVSVSGTYYIKLSNLLNACNVVLPVAVTVNPLPVLSVTAPLSVCSPNTVDLTSPALTLGSSPGSLSYYTDAGGLTTLSGANNVSVSGTYYIKLTNLLNVCNVMLPVSVTVNPLPVLSITAPAAICSPNKIDLTSSALTLGSTLGKLDYYTDPGASVSLTGASLVSVSGTYYIKLANLGNICNVVLPVNVTVNSLPVLTVTAPPAVCSPNTVNLTSAALTLGSGPGTLGYYADAGGLTTLSGAANISTSGTYFVKLTNLLNACNVMVPVAVTVNPLPVLTITSPVPVCSPNTIDLTAASLTLGSSPGALNYYTDAAGLTTLSGAANVSATGTYFVKLANILTGCNVMLPVSVTINPQPTAGIGYAGNPYCATGIATVTQTGTGGGLYSSTVGLLINPLTGSVNLTNSTAGTYTVNYTFTDGICFNTTSTSLIINALPTATVTYGILPYCASGTVSPTVTGTSGGVYSSTSGLIINSITGVIDLGASAAGIYTVTYSYSNGTCSNTSTTFVTIDALPTAVITYPGGLLCALGLSTPTHSGLTGGLYSSSAGLTIDPLTGTVNLGASTPGVYTVNYNFTNGVCSNLATTTLTVNALPALSITNPLPVCSPGTANLLSASVTAGSSGGALSYYTDALGLLTLTGAANIGTSGTYYIKLLNAGCQVIQPVSVLIDPQPSATFSYGGNPYCANGTDTPNLTGTTGGTFNAAGGLTVNSTTGAINLNGSSAGAHIVTYNFTNGTCSNSVTTTVTVNSLPTAQIGYAGPYCASGTATPTQTGNGGGTYSSTFGLSIDPATGVINLGASTAGTYTVTYDHSNGSCSNSTITSVVIDALPTASINYSGPFIASGTASPTQTGTTGGTYTSTSGLVINSITGLVNLGTSAPGNYIVTYNYSNGTCHNSAISALTIGASSAAIQYSDIPYCAIGNAPVSQVGPTGGTYSSTAGLVINSATGTIDLGASIPANYTVTYTYLDGAVTTTTSTTININALPVATINYGTVAYCATGTVSPIQTGVTGGTYTSTSGLMINPTSGVVNLDASTEGTYMINYSFTNGTCNSVTSSTITITGLPTLNVTDPPAICSPATIDLTASAISSGSSAGTLDYFKDGAVTITLTGAAAITTSGTYFIKLTNAGACSVIQPVNATLNIQPTATISYGNAAYCASGITIPNLSGVTGGVYSALTGLFINTTTGALDLQNSPAGVYTVSYNFTDGTCANVASANVTINGLPVLSVTGTASQCSPSTIDLTAAAITSGSGLGTLGYYLNANATSTLTGANAVSVSGTYYIKLTDANACSSTQSVAVTINPLPVASIHYIQSAFCAVGSINPAVYGVSGGTYSSSPGLMISTNTGTLDFKSSRTGTYPITYNYSRNGCTNSYVTTVTVNSLPGLQITNPSSVCLPASLDLTAASITSGSDPGTLNYFSDTLTTDPLTVTSAITVSGTYYIKLTDANACTAVKPVTAIVNSQTVTVSYGASSYCATTGLALPTTTGVISGIYSAGTGLMINATTGGIDLSQSIAGTYPVTYSYSDGCVGTVTGVVTVNSLPGLNITDLSVCATTLADLTAVTVTGGSGSGTLSYYSDAAGLTSLTGANAIQSSGTYYIKLSDANCSSIKPVTVTTVSCDGPLIVNPDATTTNQNTPVDICVLCNDTDADGIINISTLTITSGLADGSGILGVDPLTGIVKYTPNATFTGITTFNYSVCSYGPPIACGSAMVTVTVIPSVVIKIQPSIFPDSAVTQSGVPVTIRIITNDIDPENALEWATIDLDPEVVGLQRTFSLQGIGVFTADTLGNVTFLPVATFSGKVSIKYTINDEWSMAHLGTITITVIPIQILPWDGHIPDAFSPNGDGNNDVLYILMPSSGWKMSVSIFNRWGNVVYENDNYQNDWTGKPNKGTVLQTGDGIVPNGTYFVMVDFNDGKEKIIRPLTIMR